MRVMKVFRWSGSIGFIVFTGLLMLLGMVFLDGWLKSAIESAGLKLNGAEVNVAQVDFTLSPLGFNLEGIEIADPDSLGYNALVLSQVKVEINFLQLFLGNVRIKDLVVSDVQTNVPRARPALLAPVASALPGGESNGLAQAAQRKASALGKGLPSPSTLAGEQTRATQDAVAHALSTLTGGQATLEASVSDLPGEAALSQYQQRIAALKAMPLDSIAEVKASQAIIRALSTDMAQDKLRIETLKASMNNAVSDGKAALKAISAGPAADWARLQADYPFNANSAYKVAELLLGEAFFSKINQAQYWLAKAKPWIVRLQSEADPQADPVERLANQIVRFEHPDPSARFQLDKSLLSFAVDQWPWQLQLTDLASGRTNATEPVHIQLLGGDPKAANLRVTGQMDLIDDQRVDTFDLEGAGLVFAARQISMAGTNLSWTPEPANISGQIKAVDGRLSGLVSVRFPHNRFSVVEPEQAAAYLHAALKTVDDFRVDLKLSGTLQKPSIAVASDLDTQLSAALRVVAQAEYQAWSAAMKGALASQVALLRQPADAAFAQLTDKRAAAEQQINNFEQQVAAEVRSLDEKLSNEQQRLERAASDAVKAVKAKAQAEAAAMQAQVQAELDAAQQAAEVEKSRAEAEATEAVAKKLKNEANKLTNKIKF